LTWTQQLPAELQGRADAAIVLPKIDRPPYGIILDQGCDIEKPTAPFVHVAAVVLASDFYPPKEIEKIRNGAYGYLYPLTSTLSTAGLHLADLRGEFAIEKGSLLGRTPIDSFGTVGEYLNFADFLAARRSRPAMPKSIQEFVESPLRVAVLAASLGGFEVRVMFNDLLAPTNATLVFVAEKPFENALKAALGLLVNDLVATCSEIDVEIKPTRFETYESFSARDYRASVPLDLAEE
jgi:hypothetical protein